MDRSQTRKILVRKGKWPVPPVGHSGPVVGEDRTALFEWSLYLLPGVIGVVRTLLTANRVC
jgi:hypothetical protein